MRRAAEHFGISTGEAMEMFDVSGCGGARTALQAARYIERFVAEKLMQQTADLIDQAVASEAFDTDPFGTDPNDYTT
jgi:hypothetical protein